MIQFLSKVKHALSSMQQDKTHSDLEKFIIDNKPQTPNDIDRLEREFNQRRFTDLGRQEYFPVTR